MVDPIKVDPIKQLLTMDHEHFYAVVNDDTRNRAPKGMAAALRSPEVVERWYRTLMHMSVSVEGQLGAVTAENASKQQQLYANKRGTEAMTEQAKYEQWRAGTLRFKNGLDEKLLEARHLLRLKGDSVVLAYITDERNAALARVRQLEAAIRDHKASFDADEADADEADELLWKAVG